MRQEQIKTHKHTHIYIYRASGGVGGDDNDDDDDDDSGVLNLSAGRIPSIWFGFLVQVGGGGAGSLSLCVCVRVRVSRLSISSRTLLALIRVLSLPNFAVSGLETIITDITYSQCSKVYDF